MKKINIILVILFIAFCLVHQGMAQETVKPDGQPGVKPEVKPDGQPGVKPEVKPEVKIDQPVFVFTSVPEGVHVLHEFIIKNKGDALLRIENVLPP